MKRVSNGVITCINIVTILIAVSLIGFSVWIIVNSGSPCQRALKKPFLVFGGALLVVLLAGLVGSCCRISILYRIYLFVLALLSLIFCIAFFLFFMIVVTNMDDAGRLGNTKEDSSSHWWSNRGNGNDEYWLREVPRRIQRYLINEMIWDEIKSCWAGDKLCGAIQTGEPLDFYLHRLPPVQSGCCKPPNYCKFQFENATIWTKPKSDPEVRESDCKKWSNVQTELCFDCESCKAAILFNVKSKWAMLAMIINLYFAIIVFTVYCKLLRSQEQLLMTMSSPCPFAKWGIDLVGPFPMAPSQKRFLIVAVDYFSKWVEAEPLAKINEAVIKFLWKNVVCRFGVLRIIVSDNGSQFAGGGVKEWCSLLKIEQRFTSVYHPQANGQVEATNKIIVRGIKTRLDRVGGKWVEELHAVLWAYRTNPKENTGETPFSLVYGMDAVIPAEVEAGSHRVHIFDERQNGPLSEHALDLINEKREKAFLRMEKARTRMRAIYNKKVMLRSFQVGDLVVRKAGLVLSVGK